MSPLEAWEFIQKHGDLCDAGREGARFPSDTMKQAVRTLDDFLHVPAPASTPALKGGVVPPVTIRPELLGLRRCLNCGALTLLSDEQLHEEWHAEGKAQP